MALPETRWTVIRQAFQEPSPSSRAAMASLCETYADPVRCYIRRRVGSPERAEDLAQEFFAKLIAGQILKGADPHVGRFRSFLFHAVRGYMADAHDYENAKKRGGSATHEALSGNLSAGAMTAEMEFELKWIRAVLQNSLEKLSEEYSDGARRRLFEVLKDKLDSEQRIESRKIADELRMSDAAVRVAIHRMKARLGLIIRQEIADTLPDSTDIDDEIRNLRRILEQSG